MPNQANRLPQLVRAGIARLRLKLLDLTNNNRLLNFKFSDTSRRYVRVVDELPDHLFERLIDESVGKRLYFQALPEPPFSSRVEDVAMAGTEISTDVQASTNAKRAGKEPRINLSEWARKHGIDPSYDLPLPNGEGTAAKHGDNQIQTLLLPEVMERKLAAIRDDARLATQELGLSTLYAAFGYLEWYESENSEEQRYAPLMLLPLQMDRELKQHRYRYFVEGGDSSEATENISLIERLKRDFGFQLPSLNENDTPEAYFRRIARAIQPFPRWKLRRFACIGHFSFSRLVMYEDLSEKAWEQAPLEDNGLIASLLAGTDHGDSNNSVADEFDIESEEVEKLAPALITDADSSQHAAIVDAMKGRSFALKGPPGTGKSQTITNLISSLLAAGKKVLFVAEKQAALEVVAERLGEAGLAPYLLELHSTKVQKRQVLASFEARLKIRRRKEGDDLQRTLFDLRQTRSQLRAYVAAMNSLVGNSGFTLHNAYWEEQGARRMLPPETLALIRGLESEEYAHLTSSSYAAKCDVVDRLAKAFQTCRAGTHIKSHPLFGLERVGIGADDSLRLNSALRQLQSAVAKLERICVRRDSALGTGLPQRVNELREFTSTASSLPVVVSTLDYSLLHLVKDREALEALRNYTSNLEKFVQEREALRNAVHDIDQAQASAESHAEISAAFVRELAECGLEQHRIDRLPGAINQRGATIDTAQAALLILERFQNATGLAVPMTCAYLYELVEAIEYLKEIPVQVLRARERCLLDLAAKTDLERYSSEAGALRERRARLSVELNIPSDIDPSELAEAGRTLRETPWYGTIFSSRYRLAKRLCVRLRKAKWRDRFDSANQLLTLSEWLQEKRKFEGQLAVQKLAGSHWNGLETDFDTLIEVANFFAAVRKRWPSLDPLKQPINAILTAVDATLFSEVVESMTDAKMFAIRELGSSLRQSPQSPASERISQLRLRIERSKGMLEELRLERFRQPFSLSQLLTILRRLANLAQIAKKIEGDSFFQAQSSSALDVRTATLTTQALSYCTDVFNLVLPTHLHLQLLSTRAVLTRQAIESFGAFTSECIAELDSAIAKLASSFGLSENVWLSSREPERATVLDHLERVNRALACPEAAINEWMIYKDLASQCAQSGLSQFARLLETEQISSEHLLNSFRSTYFRSLIKRASKENPNIPRWTGETIENQRSRLRLLDKDFADRSRQYVFARLSAASIPEGVSQGPVAEKSNRALIEHEIGKQRRHIAIRELMRRASAAAHAAKPCFMMSPASVAQFLPASREVFDVAIIDEASQMRPEEALGVLARAKQAIVVGDPMQLPPTTFFDASHEDSSENGADELDVDTESVLDLALSSFRPSRELQWHYRSQHHSLIAFSNREFYDDNLIVFPSPIERSDDMGVVSLYVQDAIYHSSVNVKEVEVVVETVAQMIRANPKRSIGVVAVNQPQKELLRQSFDKLFAENSDLEEYRAHWDETLYPFFVKNLENVQGDERDAIVISTVYGPAATGASVMQRFGPINSKTGHRRLNVLFTRAKQRVVLVTSMKPEDIVTAAGSSRGVVALKNYLAYARSGRLDQGSVTGGSYDSPFEKEVAEVVHQLGYKTTPQIGVAGYFIDLGVRHPINSEHFFLGIECDGASYHSAKSARDRDRLRQEVLERLGWKLYRIWSTDWFRSRDKEVKRLAEHLRRLAGSN